MTRTEVCSLQMFKPFRIADATISFFRQTTRRLHWLILRLRWLVPLAGGLWGAFWLVFRIRLNSEGPHEIRYAGYRVLFRGVDEQVLKEVLVDQEYAFLRKLVDASPSPRILDIGAHIGTFALWCLEQAPEAQILCVEAHPGTYKTLQTNMCNWSSSGKVGGLRAECFAAGGRDGETLRIRGIGPSMSYRVDESGAITVSSLSLPSIIQLCAEDGEGIDLVKIDIEGSEEALICTHPEALRNIRALVIELHPKFCDTDRVRDTLRDACFSIVEIGGRISDKPLLFCCRDARDCVE